MLCLSTLAEHGRNVVRDARASLVVGEPEVTGDPLDSGRVTLAGHLETPAGEELDGRPGRLQGRLRPPPASTAASATSPSTCCASSACAGSAATGGWTPPTPATTTPPSRTRSRRGAAYAIEHLNADHADALLDMARALGGHPDATEATCVRIDRYGLDLPVKSPRGIAETRIAFAETANAPGRPPRRHGRARAPRALRYFLNFTFFLRICLGLAPLRD